MKLYIVRGAPNSRKAEAVVAHLGLDIELVEMDIQAGALKQDDYLALNPNGLVPTLVDGDMTLWESHAIMAYLADLNQPTSLYPQDLKARAEVNRWMCWGQTHWARAQGPILVERVLKPFLGRGETDEGAVAKAIEEFHKIAPILEAHLQQGGPFVCGPNVTLADFSLAFTAAYWPRAGVPVDPYPAIQAWNETLNAVPGWPETLPPSRLAA